MAWSSHATLLRFRRQDVEHWTETYLTTRIPPSNTTKGGQYVAPQQSSSPADHPPSATCPIEVRGVQLGSDSPWGHQPDPPPLPELPLSLEPGGVAAAAIVRAKLPP